MIPYYRRLTFPLLLSAALLLYPARAAEEHTHTSHEHEHADAHDHDRDHDHDHDHDHGHDHDHDHGHDHGHSAHDHAAEAVIVKVDAHARHIINMQVERIPDTQLAPVQSLYGHLIIPGHALENYVLPCAGRVHLQVKTAQKVKKGDELYTLTSTVYAEQLGAAQAIQADMERCWTELEAIRARVNRLAEVGTRNSELEAQLTFKVAEAAQLSGAYKIAQQRVKALAMGAEQSMRDGLPVLTVCAQSDGIVHNVGVSQNSWGEQGATVITMSNPDAMEIMGTLYAGAGLPIINEIRAALPIGRENVLLEGTWRLADQVDATKQTRNLYFTPDKLPAEARAGQLCRLDIYEQPAEPGMVSVPDSAVVKVGTDDAVFLEVDENTYAMVKVHAGASRQGMTPVSGLHPGQRVVVKGGYELKYILPGEKETKKAGHFHADGKFHESDDH